MQISRIIIAVVVFLVVVVIAYFGSRGNTLTYFNDTTPNTFDVSIDQTTQIFIAIILGIVFISGLKSGLRNQAKKENPPENKN